MIQAQCVAILRVAALTTALAALASPGLTQSPSLPETVPVPAANEPASEKQASEPAVADIPVPEARPRSEVEQAEKQTPQSAPLPTQAPVLDEDRADSLSPKPEESEERTFEPDARSARIVASELPADETACRAQLRSLGVEFEERPAESSADGCSLPYPVSVRSLGSGIVLEPAALMDCAVAETMARFTTSVIQTALKDTYGHEVKSIAQASAYVCRPRHGTGKLSEHAFGNALDIASITLEDGTSIDVKPDPDERAAKVLATIRTAACGPFKTVLGPGSDADHATHLHFDLAPRQNGGAFCQ